MGGMDRSLGLDIGVQAFVTSKKKKEAIPRDEQKDHQSTNSDWDPSRSPLLMLACHPPHFTSTLGIRRGAM